jgi:hypothetical protein
MAIDTAGQRRSRLVGDGDINVSFEFFPPKTEKMEETLWTAIRRLEPLRPRFVSVTYGAGGSTRERTHATVARLVRETSLVPAAHLTCVEATKVEVDEVARSYALAGVRHIVACAAIRLRVSAPATARIPAATPMRPTWWRDSWSGNFEVSVAGYPERHPEPSLTEDLDNLKAKVDAGANRIITSSSTTPTTCASSRRPARAASGRRSWPASCRSTISSRLRGSPAAARPCRRGWRGASTASTPTLKPRTWWRRHRRRAGDGSGRPGHPPVPFLHAESADLVTPSATRWAEAGGKQRLDNRQGGRERMTREQRIAALKAAAVRAS